MKGRAKSRRHPQTPGSKRPKRMASIPLVCFICARPFPIMPGHRVCEHCHALRGRCGNCGYTR
jgi:hypothetical protein